MRIFLLVLLSLFQSLFPKIRNQEKIPGLKAQVMILPFLYFDKNILALRIN